MRRGRERRRAAAERRASRADAAARAPGRTTDIGKRYRPTWPCLIVAAERKGRGRSTIRRVRLYAIDNSSTVGFFLIRDIRLATRVASRDDIEQIIALLSIVPTPVTQPSRAHGTMTIAQRSGGGRGAPAGTCRFAAGPVEKSAPGECH